jgi:hypothetical protein
MAGEYLRDIVERWDLQTRVVFIGFGGGTAWVTDVDRTKMRGTDARERSRGPFCNWLQDNNLILHLPFRLVLGRTDLNEIGRSFCILVYWSPD